ncbi:MAG: tetratricopeptide repeat protein [Chthoniobacteraceae bacterium]
MPTSVETPPDTGFDPYVFWMQHKGKIVLYSALLIVALVIFGVSQYVTQHKNAESTLALASAAKAEDFQKVVTDYAGTAAAADAQLRLAEQQRNEKKYDDAIATLQKFIADNPNSPLISGAWLSLGATQELAGKLDDALQTYQQCSVKYPHAYGGPISMLRQASLLQDKGKKDETRRVYENVISQYPNTYFSQAATQSLTLLPK